MKHMKVSPTEKEQFQPSGKKKRFPPYMYKKILHLVKPPAPPPPPPPPPPSLITFLMVNPLPEQFMKQEKEFKIAMCPYQYSEFTFLPVI